MSDKAFIYQGRVYVGSVGRGICLVDYEDGGAQLEDAIEEFYGRGYGLATIVITPMSPEAAKRADEDLQKAMEAKFGGARS